MSASSPSPTSFADVANSLDVGILSYWFEQEPADQCRLMLDRIKLTAKLLAQAVGAQQSAALETIAQALRFRNWHGLSAHIQFGCNAEPGIKASALPTAWIDALSPAIILMVITKDDVVLPAAQLNAFELFGQTVAMLTDAPKKVVLDAVCARLCGGTNWAEVRSRHPFKARSALYTFEAPPLDEDAEHGGHFKESPACHELIEELDELWQGYDQLSKPEQRRARQWVEEALAAQPGFLEGGLALASMQKTQSQAEASATVNRFIKQAEALIPAGYKGPILWGHTSNRFYHRLLWLQLKLHHEMADLPAAAKVARKQLRLNPGDNLGVRFVLPLLLLEADQHVTARRAVSKLLNGEDDHTAAAIRAFTEHASGHHAGFRKAMVAALISLPWLRLFLLNQRTPLPDGDDGFRGMQPDLETFSDFAWPAYNAVPGLRKACATFLAEPSLLQAEDELRRYWKGYRGRRDGTRAGTREGWDSLVSQWTERLRH
jgi:hypothetical protein